MPSKVELRRSTRNKRQTPFYESACTSPAVKRVKVDSSFIAVLNQNSQASRESIAALTATLSGKVAATSTGTEAATATDIVAAKPQEVQPSSAIIVLKVGTQALKNLTTTSIENFEVPSKVASTGNSVANANKFFHNRAGTSTEVEKPLPFGNPPAWSEVSDSPITCASVVGRLLTFCSTARRFVRPLNIFAFMRARYTITTTSSTGFCSTLRPRRANIWTRTSS